MLALAVRTKIVLAGPKLGFIGTCDTDVATRLAKQGDQRVNRLAVAFKVVLGREALFMTFAFVYATKERLAVLKAMFLRLGSVFDHFRT